MKNALNPSAAALPSPAIMTRRTRGWTLSRLCSLLPLHSPVPFRPAVGVSVVRRHRSGPSRRIPFGRALGIWMLAGVLPAFAATLTVTNTNDSGAGSLRQAILDAQPGDTIVFDPSVTGLITLTSGELLINKNLTITGPNATGPDGLPIVGIGGNQARRVFEIVYKATVTISHLIIYHGTASDGGGIYNGGSLTLTDSVVLENSANTGQGGGIYNGGSLTLTNSTVWSNSADSGGGGIYNGGKLTLTNSAVLGNSAYSGSGGGINSFYGTTLTLTNSTVWSNSASDGGGIDNGGKLTLTNSTLSGNSAKYNGGGIENKGTLTLTNSTLSGNSALTRQGGGIDNDSSSTLTFKNTLLANNGSGGNCNLFSGPTTSQGYNLSDDNSCANAFKQTSDQNNVVKGAGLASTTPQNNGGPTLTIALLPTSPAVDHIPVANCTDSQGNPLTTDQRGVTRPQGAACDVGAFELVPPVPFSSFTAQLELLTGKVSGFTLDTRFTLGANSQGIHPLTEDVTLTVGSYNVTLKAGSFQQGQSSDNYTYTGTINQVQLNVQILLLGGNTYLLQATAQPVTLKGKSNIVAVTLTVGKNTGTTVAILP